MWCFSVSDKLNNRAKEFNISSKILFLSGDYASVTIETLKKNTPFAKVAVLATEKSFLDCAMPLIDRLKNNYFKPSTVILEKQKRLKIEQTANLFNLAEDVRAVVVTDTDLIEIGLYFSTLKNVPVLFIINTFNFGGVFSRLLRVQNGKNVDFYNADCKRIIILDENILESNSIIDGIATVGGKISALIDYKISATLTGEEENTLLLENIEQAIDILLELNLVDKEKGKADILLASFLVEFGRFIDDGALYLNSSAVNCALAVCGNTIEITVAEFFSAKAIIECYVNVFSNVCNGEKIVNYSDISQKISKLFFIDEITASKDILQKLSLLSERCGGIEQLKISLRNTALLAKKEFNRVERIYHAYGGKKSYCPKKILECLHLSGYVGKGINGMTLYSESGL